MDLGGDCVRSSDSVTPISFSDWDNVKFGHFNSSLNSSLDFFVTFPSQSDVSFSVSDNDVGFESGSLTGLGLFLDGFNLNNFFFQSFVFSIGQKVVNNLGFLDGDGHSENIVQRTNFSSLN